ncbi:MAG: phosphomannose isomerase type II C-terminal cupin domain [Acidobacteriota bacterium]
MTREKDERPWGMYEVLDEGVGFKVKRIEVKPGQRLSLQSHENRSEHWVVVSGEALITLDEKEIHLKVNQDISIPVQTKHRVANPGNEKLVFIEVQCGSYLGEDDIKRYDDDYHRVAPEFKQAR